MVKQSNKKKLGRRKILAHYNKFQQKQNSARFLIK
jgi:hypothetical protein